MKKRIVALMMALMMMTMVFAGCGGSKEEKGSEKTGEPSDYKVALLIPGSLGDKSFFDASYKAVGMLEEYGMEVDYVECGNDTSKYYPAYVDMCEGGYDLILTVSSNGDDTLQQVAEEYPDQKFINLDGEMDEIPANVYIIAPKNNEMSFLAGAAAALKAEELGTDTIGFVGGMDIPGINEFLVGYIEGAQQINPDIKVSSGYVGSFTDTAKGKETGLLMYDAGIKVVFAAAGQSGLGVMDAAAQSDGYVVGVDSDQAEALKESQPEIADRIITSAIKNIPNTALYIVEKAMNDEVNYGEKEYYGLNEGAVGLAENSYYEKLLNEDARATIEELKEKVMNGEVEISNTMGMTTEELEKIRDSVRP